MENTIRNGMSWLAALIVMLAFGQDRVAMAEAPPIDHAAVLAPFVNDDTFGVAYLNVRTLDVAAEIGQLAKLLWQSTDQSQATNLAVNVFGSAVKTLQDSGVEGVYAVAGLKDAYQDGGPVLLLHLKTGSDAKAVAAMLQGFVQTLSMTVVKDWLPGKVIVRPYDAITILFGTESVVNRYEKTSATKREDLIGTLSKRSDDGAEVAAVFSPGPDFRRVVRELWPTLPEPVTPLRGELADKWLRLEFSAKSRPAASAQLCLQTTDPQSAQVFVDLLRTLPECDRFEKNAERQKKLHSYLQNIVDALPAQVDGNRVVLQFPMEDSRLEKLRAAFADFGDAALEKAHHNERMNQFKLMAISMFNYLDANKHFPASAAICDKDGKPLLSWRVAILPYLDENALYKQFNLDEPWDSPHNREVAKKMPEIYADPDPRIRTAAGEGKTTYVVPYAKGAAFEGLEGLPIRDIKDGTSKTALIVEVVPERAVDWTKPADWDVDMDHPLAGVARTDRHQFGAAYCDGSVRLLPVDIKPEIFRAILTRAGGEQIDGQY
jgi:hypothetical protein